MLSKIENTKQCAVAPQNSIISDSFWEANDYRCKTNECGYTTNNNQYVCCNSTTTSYNRLL